MTRRELTAALFAVAVCRIAGAQTFTPNDTYINLNHETNADSDLLNLYTWPTESIANAILMRFDLDAAPAGVVETATLHLFLTEADESTDELYRVTVHGVVDVDVVIAAADGFTYDGTNSWTANSCCYDGVPLAQADISAPVANELVDKTLGEKVFDVTNLVQEWINDSTSNHGLLVNSDGDAAGDRYRTFASVENGDASLRPFLVVAYASDTDGGGGGDTDSGGGDTGVITAAAAGCSAGEYYDLAAGACRVPQEKGCVAVPASAVVVLLALGRRRRR